MTELIDQNGRLKEFSNVPYLSIRDKIQNYITDRGIDLLDTITGTMKDTMISVLEVKKTTLEQTLYALRKEERKRRSTILGNEILKLNDITMNAAIKDFVTSILNDGLRSIESAEIKMCAMKLVRAYLTGK